MVSSILRYFANSTNLSCFFLFFLIIDLYILVPTVIAQIFNPTAKMAMAKRIPTKEAKPEMETYLVTAKLK